ncbi:MAG: hypothetical protein K6T29_01550 [Peptococcaceae bacterium]|nr:hypothetical protein [Peptococcaceae bacterium]
MQLPPGRRSILSYFPTSRQAQKAVAALQGAGIGEARLDRVSRYGAGNDAHYNNPVNRAETLTGPTLYSSNAQDLDDNTRVLLAADPSASGYGCKDYGVAGGRAFLVTVVVPEELVNRAVDIIKQHGGEV